MEYEYNGSLNECSQRLKFIAMLCVIVARYYEIPRILRFEDKYTIRLTKTIVKNNQPIILSVNGSHLKWNEMEQMIRMHIKSQRSIHHCHLAASIFEVELSILDKLFATRQTVLSPPSELKE